MRDAETIHTEARNHGLDPTLLAAVALAEGVDTATTGPRSELRAAARRLRGGIDRHRSVVGAVAALRVGDERTAAWLRSRPEAASAVAALPDAETRAFVRAVIDARSGYAREDTVEH
jgi:hypothetical protein